MSGSASRWARVAFIAMAVDAVGVLPVFLTGALAVQLRVGIGLEVGSLGLVYASYFLAAALLSAPLGGLSERVGPRPALRAGASVYAVSCAGISALASTPSVLLGFMMLAGLGTSLTRSASSVLISRGVRPERQGLAFGVKHCSIPVASLLAGASVPAIALTVGWRWAYAGVALLAGLSLFVIPRGIGPPGPRDHADGTILSAPVLAVAAVAFALGSSAAASLGAYTVSTAVSTGTSEATAGILVAVGSVIGLCSRLVVGHWSDRRTGSQLDLVMWMLVVGGVAFVVLGFANPIVLWLAVPLAFATGWAWVGSYNLAIVRLNPGSPGAAVGITQTGAFVGAIVGPAMLGLVAERVSFAAAWTVAAGLSLASATVIGLLRHLIEPDATDEPARIVGEPADR